MMRKVGNAYQRVSELWSKPYIKWPLILLVAAIPYIFQNNHYATILTLIAIYSISVLGYNFMAGYGGTFYMCQPAFYGIGAYTSAIISIRTGIHPIATVFIGAFVAALAGWILSLPTQRMKEMFLTIGTLAFMQIMYAVFLNATPITGGAYGMRSIPNYNFAGIVMGYKGTWLIVLAFLVLSFTIMQRLLSSRTGRAVISMAKDPSIGAAMGADMKKYRSFAFAVAAFFGGLAGGLYAHHIGYIYYGNFTLDVNTAQLAMLALGGMASLEGCIIGPAILTILTESLVSLYNYRMLIYGIILISCMVFRPQGLMGGRPVKIRKEAEKFLTTYRSKQNDTLTDMSQESQVTAGE